MTDVILGLVIGLLGGFAGGLLGIGGGAVYVPAMVLLLDEPQHSAQGASLAAIVATGLVASVAHLRNRNVDIPTAMQVAPPAVIAGFGGAFLADALGAEVLQRIFAVVMLYMSVQMIVGALRSRRAPTA